MDNAYVSNLIVTVIEHSDGEYWEDAVTEWEIDDCEEDVSCSSECVCGKENIKYLYTIRNVLNGNLLFPIGSSCIKKFNRTDMSEETILRESTFKLLHAVEDNRYLSLSTELFSRRLLRWLYDKGAFDTPYKVNAKNEGFKCRSVPMPDFSNEKIFPGGIKVKALFSADVKWRLVEEFGPECCLEAEDGRILFTGDYTDMDNLITWILTFGEKVEVIEPKEVREKIYSISNKLSEIYRR